MMTLERRNEILNEALSDLLEYYEEAAMREAESGGDSPEELEAFEELNQKCRDIKQIIEMR